MNLTPAQWLAMAIGMLGVLAAGTAQLDMMGLTTAAAKAVSAGCALASAMLAVPLSIITGQSNVVKQVQAMPGIEKLVVNSQANPTLAGLAIDPAQDKIEAAPGAAPALRATAKDS